MKTGRTGTAPDPSWLGLAAAVAGYAAFALQDAGVKWLVESFPVVEVLFVRSLVVVAIASAVGGRPAFAALRESRRKAALTVRAVLILLAWILFFTASRRLGLAELTTVYFAAPVITVALAAALLGERVGTGRWAAVLIGFCGVLLASRPGTGAALTPVLMTLGAALAWALSGILGRRIAQSEGTLSQMIAGNGLFVGACALLLPGLWRTPTWPELGLMLTLGVVGGLGQVLLYQSYRLAPASLVAPTEYTGFLWAFLLGYAIWHEVPGGAVWGGAVLILCGGGVLVWSEGRRWREGRAMPGDASERPA